METEPQYLYLTTRGWKTGRDHMIEIWFVAHGGRYYLVSEHRERSHWVRNIQREPEVAFYVGDRSFTGRGRVIDPAGEPGLAATVVALMDAKYEWSDGLIVELEPRAAR